MIEDTKQFIADGPVCLIKPPTFSNINSTGEDAVPGIGLAYLAGSLKDEGIPVVGVDAIGEAPNSFTLIPNAKNILVHGLTGPEIVERIPVDTKVIGVSCMFSSEWSFIDPILDQIRVKFPNALIVVGGEHVTACSEYILSSSAAVDVCALGEGEETIVELVKAHYNKEPLDKVPGLALRLNGEYFRTEKRKRIRDIDNIPLPYWDIFKVESYIDNSLNHGIHMGRSMPMLASRGCPYDCTFCSSPFMWTRKWSARDPQQVVDEMKMYMGRYQVTNFDFYDLTTVIRKEWILEFCDIILKENLNITWQLPSGTRSEAIDEEVLEKLYQSGCRSMSYAPESGSPEELKRIRKKVSIPKMLSSMRAANKVGIQIKTNIIFGLPGTTWPDFFKTLGFIVQLAWIGVDDISTYPYSPYPGTTMFTELVNKGRIKVNKEYFENLSGFTSVTTGISYNDIMGNRVLVVFSYLGTAFFYFLSCLFHPSRIIKVITSILSIGTLSRLHMAIIQLKKRHEVKKSLSKRQSNSLLEPSIEEEIKV